MSSSLSREFLHERDSRIYQLRATGMTPEQIAKQFDVTPKTVHNAIRRRISEINKTQLATYPELILLELERYDKLQSAAWPYTQVRRETMDDGTVITVPPDPKFVDQVLRIMKDRQKLLGLDIQRIDVQTTPDPVDMRHGLHGAIEEDDVQFEDESRQMLALAAKAGIIDQEMANALLGNQVTIEAQVIDDEPPRVQDTETDVEGQAAVSESTERNELPTEGETEGEDAS